MTDVQPLARYYFTPAVREGLAAYITAPATGERALIDARLVPIVDDAEQSTGIVAKKAGLFGPGDVLGFDPLVVTRTDPRQNVWDYEANYMPLIEFAEPDLPWRFTPDVALSDGSGRLTPWITLIALKKDEYEGLDERFADDRSKNPLPVRWIKGVPKSALPAFDTLWQWAHAHITDSSDLGDTSAPAGQMAMQAAVAGRLSEDPDASEAHVVARLICPRRLEGGTAYTAFVVPTFKIGQVAAGLKTLQGGESGVTPGWDDSTTTIDLPYYYRFEFGTSAKKGDFEYLVRLLEPRPLERLGKRPMDCSGMVYGLPDCPGTTDDSHVLDLEGALMSPQLLPGEWHNETPAIANFRDRLATVLNMAVGRAEPGGGDTDAADPKVVPPIFGRRHAQQFRVNAGLDGRWQYDVNLDPRQRAAAGYGAVVIAKDQEALMSSAWDQLGDIEDANQAMVHGQAGVEASKGVHARLEKLDVADFLWTTAPVFQRVRLDGSGTVSNLVDQSPIPAAAFDPGFRRAYRLGGGIRKRQQPGLVPRPSGRDLLSRLNERDIAAAGAAPKVPGIPSMCDITDAAVAILESETAGLRRTTATYRISGRVVDRFSHNGVRNVRVEAWDKDPILKDLIGSAVTNDRGSFQMEFSDTYYKESLLILRLDPRPDVFFKVFRNGQSLKIVAPSILRDLAPGDTSIVVEVDQSPGTSTNLPIRVTGRVVDRASRKGVPWLRVEAWDKDLMADDLVGSATTNADGAFTIAFHKSYGKEFWFLDPDADLYFKVYRGPELLVVRNNRVHQNVKPGDIPVEVQIDAPAALPGEPGSRTTDFCEPAITCEAVRKAIDRHPELALHSEIAEAVCGGIAGWLDGKPPADNRPSIDLVAVRDKVQAALDPTVTIPARVMKRLTLRAGVHQRAPLALLESEVDFPQPMYEPLAAISQDLILPGVETVPQNTISILKTNRRFMEAYMLGINDSLTSEFIWRGAPIYVWTTCARKFWSTDGLVEPDADPEMAKDITRIARWPRQTELGVHDPRAQGGVTPNGEPKDRAVLLVRGDVLKRYPNTLVYVIPVGTNGKPALAEFQDGVEAERIWPIFSGSLAPDLTFLGFDLTPAEMCTKFVVLEERLSEPRFGFDEQEDPSRTPDPLPAQKWWYDMTWTHLQPAAEAGNYVDHRSIADAAVLSPSWGASSAVMANIALQRPVRMCVHGSTMLPKSLCAEPTA